MPHRCHLQSIMKISLMTRDHCHQSLQRLSQSSWPYGGVYETFTPTSKLLLFEFLLYFSIMLFVSPPSKAVGYQFFFFFFFKFNLLIFRERGREGEREGEKHQCVVASCMSSTGDLACNPGMCPEWESHQRPFGLQASTQCTEPHQPGLVITSPIIKVWLWTYSLNTWNNVTCRVSFPILLLLIYFDLENYILVELYQGEK